MDEIMFIVKEYDFKVIEDVCYGLLFEYKGKKLGIIGDVVMFSFFLNKNISIGEGGMLIINNEKIVFKVCLFCLYGMIIMLY